MKRTVSVQVVELVGSNVFLQGWVQTIRRHGKIVFLDLRDRSGSIQLVGGKELGKVSVESVIEVTGEVKKRPQQMINEKSPTGTVEVDVQSMKVLSVAKELPLPIDTDGYAISEEVRLAYRYLDLRRDRLQKNIILRSKFVDAVRQFLFQEDFTEIETPLLTKSTPEGSRDFLVPSRLQQGKFFALPQSPQQYKQLLMVAGFERYFQIARCLRDEDLRADRGFEHTQIDIELSFVTREDVMALDERLMITVMENLGYKIKQKPFPVFTYAQAIKQFGKDKFDLRSQEDKKNGVLAFAWVVDFPFFEKTEDGGWTFTHNPFSQPRPEYTEHLLSKKNIGDILTDQYDLVCNGYEVGGGSIRANKPELLTAVFEVMGYDQSKIQEQFGHMLEAFTYGAPPHGGLAHGVERLLMTITNEPFLREVVAFPQTSHGQTAVMNAPSEVAKEQLDELGIAISATQNRSVFDELKHYLKKQKITFTESQHRPVKTSEEAALVRGVSVATGAKAIVFYADEEPIIIVVSGDRKIDMSEFKKAYGIKNLRMATPQEVLKITHVEIGAVPPFGHIFHIPLYADEALRTQETIYFNPGSHEHTIAMKETDYETAAKPIVGVFSKVKE